MMHSVCGEVMICENVIKRGRGYRNTGKQIDNIENANKRRKNNRSAHVEMASECDVVILESARRSRYSSVGWTVHTTTSHRMSSL